MVKVEVAVARGVVVDWRAVVAGATAVVVRALEVRVEVAAVAAA